MFAPQHFPEQHFAPQHFPPVLDITEGGAGGEVGQRFFVPIPRKREVIQERLENVGKRLSAKARRRLLKGFDVDRLDIQTLEAAVANEIAVLQPGRRVVDPPITRADITRGAPLLDPLDSLHLRLLLLLAC